MFEVVNCRDVGVDCDFAAREKPSRRGPIRRARVPGTTPRAKRTATVRLDISPPIARATRVALTQQNSLELHDGTPRYRFQSRLSLTPQVSIAARRVACVSFETSSRRLGSASQDSGYPFRKFTLHELFNRNWKRY